MAKVGVKVLDDGPYVIQGQVSLTGGDGEAAPDPGGTIALCRCGASSNTPFCAGSHATVGFSSQVRAS